MKKWVIALVFFAASVTPASSQTTVGNEIHDFTLADLNGSFVSAKDYRGKILGIFLLGHN